MEPIGKPTITWKETAELLGCGGANNPAAAARARIKRWNGGNPDSPVKNTRNVVDAESFAAMLAREFDRCTYGAQEAASIRRAAAKRALGGAK